MSQTHTHTHTHTPSQVGGLSRQTEHLQVVLAQIKYKVRKCLLLDRQANVHVHIKMGSDTHLIKVALINFNVVHFVLLLRGF